MHFRLVAALFVALTFSYHISQAQSAFDWGWTESQIDEVARIQDHYEAAITSESNGSIVNRIFGWYRKDVSPKQGARCGCVPSCSVFTLYSIKKYGFFIGFIMGVERLYIRENYGIFRRPRYLRVKDSENLTKIFDPPEANYVFETFDWRIIDPDHFLLRLGHLQRPTILHQNK